MMMLASSSMSLASSRASAGRATRVGVCGVARSRARGDGRASGEGVSALERGALERGRGGYGAGRARVGSTARMAREGREGVIARADNGNDGFHAPRPGVRARVRAGGDGARARGEGARGGSKRGVEAGAISDRANEGRAQKYASRVIGGDPLEELLAELPAIDGKVGEKKRYENHGAYFALYRDLVRVGRLHDAVDVLKMMKANGVGNIAARVSHRDFFDMCQSRKVVSVGFEFILLLESKDIRPYNMLLRTCATAGDSRSAFAALVVMIDAGFHPDIRAYTTLISACSKAGDVSRAFEVYDRLKSEGVAPNERTYGALVDTLKRNILKNTAGSKRHSADEHQIRLDLNRCFALHDEMIAQGLQPDIALMNSLLNACSRAATVKNVRSEAVEKSSEVYAEMKELGLKPDSFSYTSVISCAVKAGDFTRAFELFDEMTKANVKRTSEVYTVLIKAYGTMGNVAKAKETWNAMNDEGIVGDAMSYATMMHVAGSNGDEDFCDELMADMRKHRVRPSPQLYATLSGIAARQGDSAKVEEIIANAKKRGIRVPIECYNALIAAHAREDRPELAVESANSLEDAGFEPDAVTYEGLIMAFTWARDNDGAWNYFQRAMECGMRPTFPTCNALVSGFARTGDMDRAFAMVDTMKSYGYEADGITWRELLVACARANNVEMAWKVYKDSRAAGNPNSEIALNLIIGLTLAHIRKLTDLSTRSYKPPSEFGSVSEEEGNNVVQEWADRAVAAYHEATLAGVKPRMETISAMLCCLRPPTTDELSASDMSEAARAASHEASSHEDARTYYPVQALIMYEEAQSLGLVPKFALEEEDFMYDIRDFPPAAAEVMVLTWLRVVRRRTDAHGLDARIPSMLIRVRSDDEVATIAKENATGPVDEALIRLTRTGERVLVLLRRLRINYAGGLENGTIELSGHAIGRWLSGVIPLPDVNRSVFGENSLSGGLKSQAMRIRSDSFGSGENVWTPSKNARPQWSIHDYYSDDDDDDSFGAQPYYPKNWVQNSHFVSSYDEEDDITDLERILSDRK